MDRIKIYKPPDGTTQAADFHQDYLGPLDCSDMSYGTVTTVKDGVTLNLSNVDWQVIGTDLAGTLGSNGTLTPTVPTTPTVQQPA